MKNVVIITEGGRNIGFGHITRCMALYQAFEERGIIPKFIVKGDELVIDLLSNINYEIFDWIDEKEWLSVLIKNADIAIIDSYLADISIYNAVSEYVSIPVYIDDNKRLDYPKGIVVNGSIYAEDLKYPKNESVIYLLGTKYFPLRKEFWEVPEKLIKKKVESVMVTFGGYDMRNMTPKILTLLTQEFPALKKNIIILKSFKNIEEIEKIKDNKTKLFYYPNAQTMKNIMLESDIAISAAGQTTYELARVGTPAIVVSVAKNQLHNVKGWIKSGFIEYVGWWKNRDIINNLVKTIRKMEISDFRKNKHRLGKDSIDGLGSKRIFNIISENL